MLSLSLLSSMVFNTSPVSAATAVETTPAMTAFPPVDRLAARVVQRANSGGTPARATSSASRTPSARPKAARHVETYISEFDER